MNCEICGREIKGRGFKIVVEGSEVTVCAACKQYGTEKPSAATQAGVSRVIIRKRRPKGRIEFTEELVENFNVIIRREREKRGWSQEQLAKKIQEKESLIKKIENAEIVPEPRVVEKLEKLFNIKLRESVPEVKVETKRLSATPTLGDIVVVRRKKK